METLNVSYHNLLARKSPSRPERPPPPLRVRTFSFTERNNPLHSPLSSNHNNGLRVSSGQVGVERRVNDEQILSTVYLGVQIHDGGAALTSIIRPHLGSADHVDARLHSAREDRRGGGVASGAEHEGTSWAAGHVEQLVDGEGPCLAVRIRVGPRLLGEEGVTGGANGEGTAGGEAVAHEEHNVDRVVLRGAAVRLEHDVVAVGGGDSSEGVEPLERLRQNARAGVEEVLVGL